MERQQQGCSHRHWLPILLVLLALVGNGAPFFITRPGQRAVSSCRHPLASRISPSPTAITMSAVAREGDVVTVDLSVLKSDGSPLQSTFDQGEVRFILGEGGFIPAIHQAVVGLKEGEEKEVVIAPSDAFGPYYPELVAEIPMANGPPGLQKGMKVKLANGMTAFITQVNEEASTVTLDANTPNAGQSLTLRLSVKAVEGLDQFEKVHLAAGCFWGLELAFQRVVGVVGTKVGYTQGQNEFPTYSQVCSGSTGHAEAVEVIYDPKVVSFDELLQVFWDRHDPTQLNRQGNDVGTQYRGGVYYYSEQQKAAVEASRDRLQASGKYGNQPIVTEILPATTFWPAEHYHQQYLEKGGQDAKKNAQEKIRCYG